MSNDREKGRVLRVTGGEVWVGVDGRTVACRLRGRFRQRSRAIRVVAGDWVEVSARDPVDGEYAIEGLLPRATWLSRYVGGRRAVERVIIANIDILFVVISAHDPKLNPGFVDRILVSAERGGNNVRICLNKIDVAPPGPAVDEFVALYERIGYPVTPMSAATGEGIDAVAGLIDRGVYAFVGQSGVGKSSILNRIDPTLDLQVREVADKTGRGRHTTTYSQLYPLRNGFIADTPGMQTFGFPGTDKKELAACFPEFRGLETDCRFQPCTHSHEPGCAVKLRVEDGRIAASRYKSYNDMLAEVEKRDMQRY